MGAGVTAILVAMCIRLHSQMMTLPRRQQAAFLLAGPDAAQGVPMFIITGIILGHNGVMHHCLQTCDGLIKLP
jgi:hypothetical protein